MTSWLGIAFMVAACGGGTGTPAPSVATAAPTDAPIATAEPTPAPTPAPTPTEAASAATEGALCAVEYETCPIDAGTFRSDPFTPAFTFTVDDGWTNDRNWPDGGGISKGPGGVYWASGVKSGTVDGAEVTFDSTIEGFAAHLRSFDGFTVTEAPSAAIGGQDAIVLDVATGETMARGLYLITSDAFNLAPGEKARFYLLEMDGVLVIFVVDAWVEADFETVMTQSQPVLDSIVWD